ncbi:MAG: solute carrier family 23 protein, partial [Chitinophagales bacterium]
MSKPVNLIYGVNERPPALVCFFQGLQQLCMWSAGLVFPVIIARSIGLPWHEVNNLVSLSMIAGGIGTILQALSNRFIGSGYLCPEGPDPSFLAVSLSAAKMGGMPLLFGMTMFGGVFEALLSRLLPRLRILFPTEVTGTVVAMVGISVIPVAMKSLFGISGSDTVSTASEVIVGVVSILLMVAVNLWGKGSLRLYSVLVGIIGGYICALFLGVVTIGSIHQQIGQSAIFKIPFFHRQPLWAFNWSLVLPFAIATICSTLKNVGDITTCQKINDSGWRRTDMKSVQGGIMADAAASFTGGLIGGLGQASYAANIGLSLAASVTSRVV